MLAARRRLWGFWVAALLFYAAVALRRWVFGVDLGASLSLLGLFLVMLPSPRPPRR